MEIASLYLDGNPDAVAFCPHDPYTNLLAVATYTLQQPTDHDHDHDHNGQTRLGSLLIFDVEAGDRRRVELVDRVEMAGVFDIKWSPIGVKIGVGCADGGFRVYGVDGERDEGVSLKEQSDMRIGFSMCLCVDWNPTATSISVGCSDGSISLVSHSDSQLSVLQEWKAHEFELWAATFDVHQPYLLYTGSDDCKFKGWDLRTNPAAPAFQNSKAHTMGVCCIEKNPMDPYTLLTGSYDEHVRVWDVRSISKPVKDTSIGLGGGVWRIKYHPLVPDLVLAVCMHNGFAIVKINEGNAEVIETYNKHDSLAYGADWQRGGSVKGTSNVVATCSFYDRLLRLWIPEKIGGVLS